MGDSDVGWAAGLRFIATAQATTSRMKAAKAQDHSVRWWARVSRGSTMNGYASSPTKLPTLLAA